MMTGGDGRTPEPLKLREQAYEGYTRSLLTREIAAGQFITQRQLVEITGFPLGAIRELVPRLEAEGLIRTAPHRGMQVPQVDLNLVRNAFQLRLFLEEPAVRLYAADADAAEVASLREAHERILARHEAGDEATLMQDAEAVDLKLHEAIVDHLHNEIVSNAYRVNWIKIKLIRLSETRLYVPMIPQVIGEHLRIIAAVERRDPDEAARAMAAHIETARQRPGAVGRPNRRPDLPERPDRHGHGPHSLGRLRRAARADEHTSDLQSHPSSAGAVVWW
jgi:DNA-binding GntR family transcriptional regulator